MNADQILSDLWVGSYPRNREDIVQLRDRFGVSAVLNLQSDADLAYWSLDWPQLEDSYSQLGVLVRRVPIIDFDHESLTRMLPECVDVLAGLRNAEHTVYVHCNAGINRSPSVVIAYLHRVLAWDLSLAIECVQERHYCDPDIAAIREAGADNS